MAISLPSETGGSVLPEYAAHTSVTQRTIRKIGDAMVAVFSGSLAYSRIDYLVQNGKKVAVVTSDAIQPGMPNPASSSGNVQLTAEAFAAAMAADAELLAAFEKIAAFEDSLIRADLVAKGIITI
jgi:glutamate 5-kinase